MIVLGILPKGMKRSVIRVVAVGDKKEPKKKCRKYKIKKPHKLIKMSGHNRRHEDE